MENRPLTVTEVKQMFAATDKAREDAAWRKAMAEVLICSRCGGYGKLANIGGKEQPASAGVEKLRRVVMGFVAIEIIACPDCGGKGEITENRGG